MGEAGELRVGDRLYGNGKKTIVIEDVSFLVLDEPVFADSPWDMVA
jgi:hypothetical protein